MKFGWTFVVDALLVGTRKRDEMQFIVISGDTEGGGRRGRGNDPGVAAVSKVGWILFQRTIW